jgi:hypothetical protein
LPYRIRELRRGAAVLEYPEGEVVVIGESSKVIERDSCEVPLAEVCRGVKVLG